MKKFLHVSLLLGICLSFSGCVFTYLLWGEGYKNSYTTNTQKLGDDKIYAFGVGKKDTNEFEKNSLIMMGEKYWYVLPAKSSLELIKVAKIKLPKAFTIQNGVKNGSFPVQILEEKGKFYSRFCLEYKASHADEAQKLEKLDFKLQSGKKTLSKCFYVNGKYFNAQNLQNVDYTFENSINAYLYSQQTKEDHIANLGNRLELIALTPISLALDAASIAIVIPLAIVTGTFDELTD